MLNQSPLAHLRDIVGLKPTDFRPITVTLLDQATPSAAGVGTGDTYQVPSTHKFLLTGIRGVIGEKTLAGELAEAAPADLATTMEGRYLARLLRTVVKVWSKDRHDDMMLERPMSLASICPSAGGKVWDLGRMPQIFSPGESIGMELSFLGLGPQHIIGVAGADPCTMGVVLEGVLVAKDLPTKTLGMVADLLREYATLSSDSYRRVAVTLEAAPPADGSEMAEVPFRIPSNYKFAIEEIRGHVTFNDYADEIAAGVEAVKYSTDIRQRLVLRTARTVVRLKTTDNGQDMEILRGDNKHPGTGGVPLSSLCVPTGEALKFNFPRIVQNNETVTLNLNWLGTKVPLVTGNDYPNNNRFGLTLIGTFARV